MSRLIGLHLRFEKNIIEIIDIIKRYNVNIFQCFLHNNSYKFTTVAHDNCALFAALENQCPIRCAHASYRINIADPSRHRHPILEKELQIATRLNFTHLVIHPGSCANVQSGIDTIARLANTVCSKYPIKIVLENVVFSSPSLGGNFSIFPRILEKIDKPDMIGLCIDTAHAFSFGYAIDTSFIDYIEKTCGLENICLIHLNNTLATQGSELDTHCRFSQGVLETKKLISFAIDKRINSLPIILELPSIPETEEHEDLSLSRLLISKAHQ